MDLPRNLLPLQNEPFEHGAVDRRAIHLSRNDHFYGGAVTTRLDHCAEEVVAIGDAGQVGSHDVKTRMRPGLVIRPGRASQIVENMEGTVAFDHDVRKVNRSISVARSKWNRNREQFDIDGSRLDFVHIRQTA